MTKTVTEARADLPSLLDAVLEGHEVTITRHGTPVAVLVSPDLARQGRTARAYAGAARVHQLLEDARGRPIFEGPGLTPEGAAELLAWVRAGRDAE
jgi:prevent-host-death family protein